MRLILLELNEINFDTVKDYLNKGETLNNFKHLIENNLIVTRSEDEYQNIEPWIQWVSVHTGLDYKSHKVFRLGDIVNHRHEQIFEKIEKLGFKVGAISPMNAANNLMNPDYFIPDPWTKTSSDNSFLSKILSDSISQAVNDNAKSKITILSVLKLVYAFLTIISMKDKINLIFFVLSTLRKPWRKSLVLDLFLFYVHKELFIKKNTNFSTIFLNAGAHIQHHYFFNSKVIKNSKFKNPSWYIKEKYDPIIDMLRVYDKILGELNNINNTEIIVATGMSQVPYNNIKFYYRLSNHKNFLKKLNLKFDKVIPRMTRDFLILFNNKADQEEAYNYLKKITVSDDSLLFEEIEKMNNNLFVTLTYSNEITKDMFITINGKKIHLFDQVVFVAVKNGMHQSKGYAYFSDGIKKSIPKNNDHVLNINKTVLSFFESEI
tara:strand:+ start:210 stop:1508 length:1299 start_codon:yes stop_codon:yes gene_type:complete